MYMSQHQTLFSSYNVKILYKFSQHQKASYTIDDLHITSPEVITFFCRTYSSIVRDRSNFVFITPSEYSFPYDRLYFVFFRTPPCTIPIPQDFDVSRADEVESASNPTMSSHSASTTSQSLTTSITTTTSQSTTTSTTKFNKDDNIVKDSSSSAHGVH